MTLNTKNFPSVNFHCLSKNLFRSTGSSLSCLSRGQEEGYDVRVYNSTGRFAKSIKTERFLQAINLCVSVPGVRSQKNESFAVCTSQVTQGESFNSIRDLSGRKATAGCVCLLRATFMSQVVLPSVLLYANVLEKKYT